jgi:hypothetical protein
MNRASAPDSRRTSPVVGKAWFAVLTVAFFALAVAFFLRSRSFARCCDALGYLELGQSIRLHGLTAKMLLSYLRTVGYPAFIALVARFPSRVGLDLKVAVAQTLLYWLAVAALLRSSRRILAELRSRRALAVGLLLNPCAAMYCAETMTESLSLTLFLACIVVALATPRGGFDPVRRNLLRFALGLLAGYALIVRPANLVLVLSATLAVAAPEIFSRSKLLPRLRELVIALAALWVGVYVAISPQIAVNQKHFGKATPLPVAQLGELQIGEGIRMLKYGTFVGPKTYRPIRYPNPFAEGTFIRAQDTYRWYLRYPGMGTLTVVGHVFAALALEPFHVYTRDLNPWYEMPVAALNGFVVVFGLGWLAIQLWRNRRRAVVSPPAWLLVSALASSFGLLAVACPETRFGVIAISVAFAAVCVGAERTVTSRKARPALVVGGVVASLLFAMLVIALGSSASV